MGLLFSQPYWIEPHSLQPFLFVPFLLYQLQVLVLKVAVLNIIDLFLEILHLRYILYLVVGEVILLKLKFIKKSSSLLHTEV